MIDKKELVDAISKPFGEAVVSDVFVDDDVNYGTAIAVGIKIAFNGKEARVGHELNKKQLGNIPVEHVAAVFRAIAWANALRVFREPDAD